MIVITTSRECRYRVEYHLTGTLVAALESDDLHVALEQIKTNMVHMHVVSNAWKVVPLPSKGKV